MPEITPYLSIVVVSRNDNHGEHLIERTQLFINSLYEQCNHFKINTELIIVEWNPPKNRKSLYKEFQWPKENKYVTTKIIVVPSEIHTTFQYSDKLPLFQMIGKNVGIRRAHGEFILATNIDILFSDELMEYLSHKNLKKDALYRVDRIDIASMFDNKLFNFYFKPQELLLRSRLLRNHCKNNVIRINTKYGTFSNESGLKKVGLTFIKKIYCYYQKYCKNIPFSGLIHTNACGDFTLMSKSQWMDIRGYPELEMFSWHIDSLLLVIAYHSGIKEIDLSYPKIVFHIEHGLTSGWNRTNADEILPEEPKEKEIPIPVLSSEECVAFSRIIDRMSDKEKNFYLNNPDWGLEKFQLDELIIGNE